MGAARGCGILARMRSTLRRGALPAFLWSVGLLLVACGGGGGARVDESLSGRLQRVAATAAAKDPGAGRAYLEILRAAIDADSTTTAARAAQGLKELVYLTREDSLLRAGGEALLAALPSEARSFEALTQIAWAYDLLGMPDPGRDLLRAAAGRAPDPRTRARIERAERLSRRAPDMELLGIRVTHGAESPSSPVWDEAGDVELVRADQVISGVDAWRGPDDASLRVRGAALIGNLFFLVDVTDDEIIAGSAAGDELVFAFSLVRGSATYHRRDPVAQGNAFALAVPVGATAERQLVPGQTRCWYESVPAEGGVRVVVCVPEGAIPGLMSEPGDSYAFDVLYRDRDGDAATLLRAFEVNEDPSTLLVAGTFVVPDELHDE